ncbi:MAG: hypothetical protein HYV09_18070 [Deltaproteobacteria bacterium]|nr:hypothetical protein [Deltaproteobacteria bacterium]
MPTFESPIEERRAELRRALPPTLQVPELDAWTGDVATTYVLVVAVKSRAATPYITPRILAPLCDADAFRDALIAYLRAGHTNPWPAPLGMWNGGVTAATAAELEVWDTLVHHGVVVAAGAG